MIRLFSGCDPREALGFHVFMASVLQRASAPIGITALEGRGLPAGSNDFTFSRFIVPWLCEFEGHAIFVDGCDMLALRDIAELDALFDPAFAVQVVKHPNYRTRNPIKYRGTPMECPNVDYQRKNWASVMLMNCEHEFWQDITPSELPSRAGRQLLQFEGLPDDQIGALPDHWNRLADEAQPIEGASILHWTAGMPGFDRYKAAPGAEHWHEQHNAMMELG